MSAQTAEKEASMNEREQAKKILARILSFRPGRENAISSTRLAERSPVGPSRVLDLIPEVMDEYDIAIGSCQRGYFLIDSKEELHTQIQRAKRTKEKKKRRMELLASAFNRPPRMRSDDT